MAGLVCGINDQNIQRKLLSESSLTYEKAVDIAISMETADKDSQDLRKLGNQCSQFKQVHHVRLGVQKHVAGTTKPPLVAGSARSLCYRCGGRQNSSECWFKDSECHHCGKKGNIKKVCSSYSKK